MPGALTLPRLVKLVVATALALAGAPSLAAVNITFYSKELGSSFPHAFIRLEGLPDRGGSPVDQSYGFTARSVSPAILMGAVKGVLSEEKDAYVRRSDKHFTFTLTDGEYDRVLEEVNLWRDAPQPSYDLNRRNCIHFVARVAAIVGMRADTNRFMKKPRSYLEALARANREWLVGRGAAFHRD